MVALPTATPAMKATMARTIVLRICVSPMREERPHTAELFSESAYLRIVRVGGDRAHVWLTRRPTTSTVAGRFLHSPRPRNARAGKFALRRWRTRYLCSPHAIRRSGGKADANHWYSLVWPRCS